MYKYMCMDIEKSKSYFYNTKTKEVILVSGTTQRSFDSKRFLSYIFLCLLNLLGVIDYLKILDPIAELIKRYNTTLLLVLAFFVPSCIAIALSYKIFKSNSFKVTGGNSDLFEIVRYRQKKIKILFFSLLFVFIVIFFLVNILAPKQAAFFFFLCACIGIEIIYILCLDNPFVKLEENSTIEILK